MSITITKESKGFLVVNIQGIYTYDDQKEIEKYSDGNVGADQKVKILVLAEAFTGWGKEGDWGDLTFMYENDPHIKKIAVVADEKWKDQFFMFLGAGRRQAAIEFFLPNEVEDARDWINGEND